MKKIFVLIVALFSLSFLVTAENGKIELKLYLRDGSVITGTSKSVKEVQLKTDYGALSIPVKNVNTIVFGIYANESQKKNIENLLGQLIAGEGEQQKAAYDELLEQNVNSLPVIRDYIYSEEYVYDESRGLYSPESVYDYLKAKHGVNEPFNEKDVISMDMAYEMGGYFNIKDINIETEYGKLVIPKIEIEKIEVFYDDLSGSGKMFQLLASKHIQANNDGGWLNTGIKVKAGQKIIIMASGEVMLKSLSNKSYTPDGQKGSKHSYSSSYTYPQYGNLVYRIGESGQMTRAGSKYKGIAKRSGTLYLSIYETVFNKSNTGTYTVRVNVK